MKSKYLSHRWEIENDKVHWKLILNSADDFGPVFHLDFSENINGTPKYEVQSAHFHKSQFCMFLLLTKLLRGTDTTTTFLITTHMILHSLVMYQEISLNNMTTLIL